MKDKSFFDAKSTLDSSGVFCIFGEIDSNISQSAVEHILAHNLVNKPLKNITLFINSQGGNLDDAFAIIDCMTYSKIPVHTVGLGEICSSGLMIFMAGNSGNRKLMKNTTVMSHQWSGEIHGKQFELMNAQAEFEQISLKVNSHYLKYSKLNEEEIKKILLPPHDVYLTSEQAIEYGLADGLY